jgi:uncharacterized protein DUF4123
MSGSFDVPLPEALQPTCDALVAALVEAAGTEGMNFVATIDLAAVDDAAGWLTWLRQRQAHNLLESQPEGRFKHLVCWLLPLHEAGAVDVSRLRLSVAQALQADSVTWLSTELSAEALAQRLSRRLNARWQGQSALFRTYDPRVLPAIRQAWPHGKDEGLFALGARWYYLDTANQLQSVLLSAPTTPDSFTAPVIVRDTQYAAMQAVTERYQVVRWLAQRDLEGFAGWPAHQKHAWVQAQQLRWVKQRQGDSTELLRICLSALRDASTGASPSSPGVTR